MQWMVDKNVEPVYPLFCCGGITPCTWAMREDVIKRHVLFGRVLLLVEIGVRMG